jgi:plasmid stabilization system protein ParE
MDPIALLCSLHGDGTETLARLRSAGCDSLRDVGELDPSRLSSILESTPAAARRFRRQARTLAQRLGEGAQSGRRGAPPPVLSAADRRLFDRVLDAWRSRDEGTLDREPQAEPSRPLEVVDEPEPELVRLDRELAASLAQAGVATVEAMAELEEDELLELVDATEIAYTRLARLRGLARRVLGGAGDGDEEERRFSDSDPTGERRLDGDVELIPHSRRT